MRKELRISLQEQGYFCDKSTALAVEAALSCRPTAGAFLFGPAGSGKTFLPEALARILEREVIFFQCFPGTREDDLLVKLIPHENSVSGIKAIDGPVLEAAKASQDRPVFLVLDEWDKTRPSADSFLLDFLQSGRIRFNGCSCTANTQNITVWVTMNDERELSEPLLRRLPLIHFKHLPVSRVKEALELSHPNHPYIEASLVLYERCLMAGMPKPATIQELRQLLDAITVLGDRADWNALVFQFVTKTRENHALLKSVEGQDIHSQQEEWDGLDPAAYEERLPEVSDYIQKEPRMPRLAEARGMTSVADDTPEHIDGVTITPDLTEVGGVVALNDNTYDAIVGMCENPTDDPNKLEIARVVGDKIIIDCPIDLGHYELVAPMQGEEGEVVFTAHFPLSYIKHLRKKGLKIVKFSRPEIVGKSTGVDFRAVLNKRDYYDCEIIVDLKKWDHFISVFNPLPKSGETDDKAIIRQLIRSHVRFVHDKEYPCRNYNMTYRSENGTLYYTFNYNFEGKTLEEVKKELGLC